MQAATTGLANKVARLIKPIPENGIGTSSLKRRIGDQCVILRTMKDIGGRTLHRVVFEDGEERMLLETDVETIDDGQGTD